MKEETYPIYFTNGTCGACGAKHAIKKIDKFNREAKKIDIFPIYRMRCSACGREFFIRWEEINDQDHSATPVSVSRNAIDRFMEETRREQEEKKKDLQIPYDRYEVTDFGTF